MIRGASALVVGALAVLAAPGAAGAASGFSDHHCEEHLVLCLDAGGNLIPGERREAFRVNERVHVIVLGKRSDKITITIDIHGVISANSMLPGSRRVGAKGELLPVDFTWESAEKLVERLVDIPNAEELILYVVQAGSDGSWSNTGSLSFPIHDTLYFARAGLSFTWVDRGSRTITAEYSIVEKTDFYPGVALTIWPWGHRGKTLSALEKGSWGRALGDAIALQVGTDFDFSKPFDRASFGLVLEPISGLGISAGFAITTGQFFSGAPSGSAMTIVERRMARPFVSLALTSELFNTIKELAGKKAEKKE